MKYINTEETTCRKLQRVLRGATYQDDEGSDADAHIVEGEWSPVDENNLEYDLLKVNVFYNSLLEKTVTDKKDYDLKVRSM